MLLAALFCFSQEHQMNMNMMMDMSPLLLIEDTADSEGETTGFFITLCPDAEEATNNNDDAESCTSGSNDYNNCSHMWISSEEMMKCSSSSPDFFVEDDDDEEVESIRVDVNEVEDKLFWEICIAMGYP
ncbi:hypothetical protein PIB30_018861 [Stylosanthes scabra]|uniref:Uncharacterized protein n=1 Tax=Stylosanthes scabra TaxID=79078 RepID=A0ABU6U796_9FABA|nr:hypothetical protein [Stylosanthes scabra]